MSKLSLEKEIITGTAKPKENPYAIKPERFSYRKEREELGTPITQGRLDDFIREMETNPHEPHGLPR